MNESSTARESIIVFHGGTLGWLMDKMGLDGDSAFDAARRVVFWIFLVWVPPMVAFGVGALFFSEDIALSLPKDFSFHVRCLLSIPLLVSVEDRIQKEFRGVVPAILSRGMIRADRIPKLHAIARQVRRLQTSAAVDPLLLFFAVLMVATRLYYDIPDTTESWKTNKALHYVFAQVWNQWVALTVYYYFVFRWIWRFVAWSCFLVRVTFLLPDLKSLHPDRVGGLGFLLRYHRMFAPVAVAVSATASANIALLVLYGNSNLDAFLEPLLLYVFIFDICIALPLVPFTPFLIVSRNQGIVRYSRVANSYAGEFALKWYDRVEEREKPNPILGNPDFQSLNDLHGSYRSLVQMRISLMDSRTLTVMTIMIVAPFAPLILFKIPILELMRIIAEKFFRF